MKRIFHLYPFPAVQACVVAVVLAGGMTGAIVVCGDEAPLAERVNQLIQDLDDPRFAIRERADQQLLELGEAAVPALARVDESASAEVRFRARRIVALIQRRILDAAFDELAQQPDESLDVERGMWLISRLLNPACQREALDKTLDDLARRVRLKLGAETEPQEADPRAVTAAIRQVLFVEEGFNGNVADYHSPDNSSLEKVLESKNGLPILLSQVVMSVGRRLEVPIVGLALPLRFMVKYDGTRAPEGFPREDVILDPYGGGRELTAAQVAEVIGNMGSGIDPKEHFRPAQPRAMLVRMLSNLGTHLEYAERSSEAVQVARYRRLFEAAPAVPVPPRR